MPLCHVSGFVSVRVICLSIMFQDLCRPSDISLCHVSRFVHVSLSCFRVCVALLTSLSVMFQDLYRPSDISLCHVPGSV